MTVAISVIMPVFNEQKFLHTAVNSVLAQQNLPKLELICINDGSTDKSGQILDQLARHDQRVKVKHSEHKGIVDTLNQGLDMARYPLLARMDADDVAHPLRLSLQAKLINAHPNVGVVGTQVRSFPRQNVHEGFQLYERWLNTTLTPTDFAREIFIESPIAHPSALMRTHELLSMGGYRNKPWAEDYDLWLRYHQAGYDMVKVPRTLLFWRMYPERLSFTDPRCSIENFFRCKAWFLARDNRIKNKPVSIWGAGITGKRLARQLLALGVAIENFIDIDPLKIGRTRYTLPVYSPSTHFNLYPQNFVLIAVGARRVREQIRQELKHLTETVNYIFCA